jgi:hypothetical protein
MLSRLRLLALAGLFSTALAAPAHAGPPWISIELPANPYDQATRGAFLVVHAFHHGVPVAFPVTGTAEGIVDGQRRSVPLQFTATAKTGEYALRRMWPREGTWTLVISVTQGTSDKATAVIEIGPDGDVASVKVPTHRRGDWVIPSPVAMSDIDAGLRARAGALAAND